MLSYQSFFYQLIVVVVVVVATTSAATTAATAHADHHHQRLRSRYLQHSRTLQEPTTTNADSLLFRNETQDLLLRRRRDAAATTAFKILNFAAIETQLLALEQQYPQLVKVTTSQQKYNLAAAGGYKNYIITIQDYVVHPDNSDSSNRLPEVLLSGALHGDERVGPTVVVETAKLLLQAAACEAKRTVKCRNALKRKGIDDANRQWLARLVTTRRVVIVPTANAMGYAKGVREEGNIDPNRDFAFDQQPSKCMQSIAARTLNEVFRDHQFQLAITFHGGMEVISYEWGATSYEGTSSVSPDDTAQRQISAAYSKFGGAFSGSPQYAYGISNQVVYGVYGGMEDWAYAGSWDTKLAVKCNPSTYGGYPAAKTTYTSGMLRAFNILIEISNDKTPANSKLGSNKNLLSPNASTGNGYVSRCIRQSLLAIDLVEPYVTIETAQGKALAIDLIPKKKRNNRTCKTTKAVEVEATSNVPLNFTVGGALRMDLVEIWYGKWDDIPTSSLDCISQPSYSNVKTYLKAGTIVGSASGNGRFTTSGSATVFRASLDLSGYEAGDSIVVLASARVDSEWGKKDPNATPSVVPQAHIVNARTNPSWKETNQGKVIQGRLDWFSDPLTLTIV